MGKALDKLNRAAPDLTPLQRAKLAQFDGHEEVVELSTTVVHVKPFSRINEHGDVEHVDGYTYTRVSHPNLGRSGTPSGGRSSAKPATRPQLGVMQPGPFHDYPEAAPGTTHRSLYGSWAAPSSTHGQDSTSTPAAPSAAPRPQLGVMQPGPFHDYPEAAPGTTHRSLYGGWAAPQGSSHLSMVPVNGSAVKLYPGDKVYRHPQGSTIIIHNGVLTKYNKKGNKVATSATIQNLQSGHGGWREQVSDNIKPVAWGQPVGATLMRMNAPVNNHDSMAGRFHGMSDNHLQGILNDPNTPAGVKRYAHAEIQARSRNGPDLSAYKPMSIPELRTMLVDRNVPANVKRKINAELESRGAGWGQPRGNAKMDVSDPEGASYGTGGSTDVKAMTLYQLEDTWNNAPYPASPEEKPFMDAVAAELKARSSMRDQPKVTVESHHSFDRQLDARQRYRSGDEMNDDDMAAYDEYLANADAGEHEMGEAEPDLTSEMKLNPWLNAFVGNGGHFPTRPEIDAAKKSTFAHDLLHGVGPKKAWTPPGGGNSHMTTNVNDFSAHAGGNHDSSTWAPGTMFSVPSQQDFLGPDAPTMVKGHTYTGTDSSGEPVTGTYVGINPDGSIRMQKSGDPSPGVQSDMSFATDRAAASGKSPGWMSEVAIAQEMATGAGGDKARLAALEAELRRRVDKKATDAEVRDLRLRNGESSGSGGWDRHKSALAPSSDLSLNSVLDKWLPVQEGKLRTHPENDHLRPTTEMSDSEIAAELASGHADDARTALLLKELRSRSSSQLSTGSALASLHEKAKANRARNAAATARFLNRPIAFG